MREDLVSVIIPTFGRPHFLRRCVESVNSQTYDRIEIIIVDDNSRSHVRQLETAKIVASIECKFPIKYVVHEENQGGAVARNTGVKKAEGEFIAFLDDDDESDPDRILRQVHLLRNESAEDPSIQACVCLAKRRKHGQEVDRQKPRQKDNYLFELLALKESIYSSVIIINKHAFSELGGFDGRFRRNQDVEFMIRFFERYNVALLNEHLTILNIDDRSNIPSYQRIVDTKQLFLQKFKPVISKLTVEQQREVYKSNALQIAKVALWNKNLVGFVKGIRSAKLSLNEWGDFAKDVLKKSIMHLK